MNQTLEFKLSQLPESPGVYQMKHGGEIIYVGKAVNLKNRVRQYFHASKDHTPKVQAMVSNIEDFDIILCDTELEALILECNLIKKYRPYYNILLKDDKQYPYIRIDLKQDYPRVELVRRVEKDGAKYFGPYIGATVVRDVLEVLHNSFPLRTCKHEFSFGHGMGGTWGIGARLKDMSFVEDLKHTFRVAYWGGTNSTAMVKYMNNASSWADGYNTDVNGPYLTTNDGLLEFNLVNSYQMYENFDVNLELGYIVNFMDNDTWKKAGERNSSFQKQDMWKAQLIFAYSF